MNYSSVSMFLKSPGLPPRGHRRRRLILQKRMLPLNMIMRMDLSMMALFELIF